jgi:hypothetical protein
MSERFRIQCDAVPYRQGTIEVLSRVHEGCVNLETWNVSADTDLSSFELGDGSRAAGSVLANTELELRPSEARQLAEALITAARRAEASQF